MSSSSDDEPSARLSHQVRFRCRVAHPVDGAVCADPNRLRRDTGPVVFQDTEPPASPYCSRVWLIRHPPAVDDGFLHRIESPFADPLANYHSTGGTSLSPRVIHWRMNCCSWSVIRKGYHSHIGHQPNQGRLFSSRWSLCCRDFQRCLASPGSERRNASRYSSSTADERTYVEGRWI
jgi:hypothetical protein